MQFQSLKQPIIYVFVGLANTALTAIIMFSLMAIGVHVLLANAIGYTAGLILSFLLNSRLTFKIELKGTTLLRFLIVAGVAYMANVGVVIFVINLTSSKYIAQIVGMPVYTVVGYIANKYWAMKE